jgi:hypothetical protein
VLLQSLSVSVRELLEGLAALGAVHDLLVEPVPTPKHVQDHGPVPETAGLEPSLHSPLVGFTPVLAPLAVPQDPFDTGEVQ